MPKLDWIGKRYVVNHTEEVPFRLLQKIPEASMDDGGTPSGNMVVHGDNLEALKALLPYYREKVKLVFIDPPYNTGNENWVYNDRMNAPKIRAWLGKVVGGEGEDLSRHDKWLCMMYPRLSLLRDLLAADGSLWMTIDDNEAHYAKVLVDEIFGRDNFIASVIWQKVYGARNAKHFSDDHDYVLVYAKNAETWRPNLLPRTEKQDKAYKNPDNDSRGPWKPGDLSARNFFSLGTYPITAPSGRVITGPPKGNYWRYSEKRFEELDADGRIWWGEKGNNVPSIKRFLSEVRQGLVPQTIWTYDQAGHNQIAKQELVRLMDFQETSDVFITPKPVKLLQRILQVATDRDSIVLDSFAGSGTTAHAVLKQNAEDGGERRFVLVEMEDYADSLTAERVRRVIRGEGGQPFLGDETGFDFYALGEELFAASGDDVNPEIKREELGRFVLFLETGVAAEKVGANGTGYIGSGDGKDVYLFYAPDTTTTFGEQDLDALPGDPGANERVVRGSLRGGRGEVDEAWSVVSQDPARPSKPRRPVEGQRAMRLLQSYASAMDLKDYQRRVLEELGGYAENVAQLRGVSAIKNPVGVAFTDRTGRSWQPLTSEPGTPFVCLKVPTGGGKTLIAAHAACLLYDVLLRDKDDRGIILWLTPSDTIRSQTLRALKDPDHPYRRVLQGGFGNAVHVMDNVEALRVRPDQVRDGLTVIVSTMQAMKREDKEGLKAYEDNGYLQAHFTAGDESAEVRFSLFEVIRRARPLVIADEGHNAKTVLALDLIESLEPSFVLELTATPAGRSNVLSEVSALELKEEQMVKLPINLTNEVNWESALRSAVHKRDELEEIARQERDATGEYIRPMVLVQAEQEKEHSDKVHVARVREFLTKDLGIPEGQIKIKTGKQDELGATDLLAEDVEVRYIITRDALKEGWDAPFAYVLASVFNLGSPTAVEQLLGRILRLPNVREKENGELNEGYVYTSAEQFNKAVGSIVKGMVENGYSADEVRTSTAQPKYTETMSAVTKGSPYL